MKKFLFAFAFVCLGAPAFADTSSAPTTMKFDSIPVAEKVGADEHKIYPYRSEGTVLVVVIDPIACGQKHPARWNATRGTASKACRFTLARAIASAA